MTDVLALDIATTTGWARGVVGFTPRSGSVNFAAHAGSSDSAVFARALSWLSEFLREDRPDMVVVEAMLPPTAMHGATSRAVRDRLAGLHGIVRAVAYLRALHSIEAVAVGDVRAHFLGDRGLKRDAAKRATVERCRALGWECESDDEGDALALWSYACGRIDPATALRVSPLFNRALRVSQ